MLSPSIDFIVILLVVRILFMCDYYDAFMACTVRCKWSVRGKLNPGMLWIARLMYAGKQKGTSADPARGGPNDPAYGETGK